MTAGSWRRLRRTTSALWLGAIALTGGLAPVQAATQYLDLGLGGVAVSVSVESFQEQKYKTTIAQEHDFSCGSAALATLLSYNYNTPVSESDVFDEMIANGDKKVISESGFSLLDIKNYLTRHGLDSNGYRAPLEKLAEVRLPAIVLINVRGYRHFVVLEGIRDGRILLSDPAIGIRTEPVGVFESEWSGVFFLVLSNVDQAQQGFNSTQKWATAPGPPTDLTRYAVDLATLAQPTMLGLGRF